MGFMPQVLLVCIVFIAVEGFCTHCSSEFISIVCLTAVLFQLVFCNAVGPSR